MTLAQATGHFFASVSGSGAPGLSEEYRVSAMLLGLVHRTAVTEKTYNGYSRP